LEFCVINSRSPALPINAHRILNARRTRQEQSRLAPHAPGYTTRPMTKRAWAEYIICRFDGDSIIGEQTAFSTKELSAVQIENKVILASVQSCPFQFLLHTADKEVQFIFFLPAKPQHFKILERHACSWKDGLLENNRIKLGDNGRAIEAFFKIQFISEFNIRVFMLTNIAHIPRDYITQALVLLQPGLGAVQ
jgi:hypothetical protein